jgi:predicted nucleic acid-binding protein
VTLVDTSVWVEHLGRGVPELARLLEANEVAVHPFVIGELACGRLGRRSEILRLLSALPTLAGVSHDEALAFVEAEGLAGTGIGWIDVHLLAAARVAKCGLWSDDQRLVRAARRLGLA